MRSKSVALLVLLVFLAMGTSAHAEEQHESRFIKKMTAELELSSAQQKKLKKIHDSSKADMKSKHKAMLEAQDTLDKTLHSDASDDEVRTKFNDLVKKQDDFTKARLEKILQVRKILSPEQRAKLQAMPYHNDNWKEKEH